MKKNLTTMNESSSTSASPKRKKRTGAQIVLAVVDRSDVYAELPWKAFALGHRPPVWSSRLWTSSCRRGIRRRWCCQL